MNIIKFSHNWNNKLTQKVFTTIRTYTDWKFEFYQKQHNREFEIVLNNETIGKCKLRREEIIIYKDIPRALLASDTGLTDFANIYEIFKKFGMKDIESKMIILTFEKI